VTTYPGSVRAPSPGRGVLAGVLVTLGLIALALAALVWTPTHNLVTREGFADATVTALRSEAGRRAITDEVERTVRARLADLGIQVPATLDEDLGSAVRAVVADPTLESILRGTIESSYTQVVEEGGDTIALDLGPLRDELARQLSVVDPRLAQRLPTADQLGTLDVSLGDRAPEARRIAEAADLARVLPPILLAAGIALLAIGVAVSARRRGLARTAAVVMLLIAAIPLAIRFLGPAIASRAVSDEDKDLVEQLAEDAVAGWWIASLAALLLAAALAVVWLTSRSAPGRRSSPLWYE